MSPLALIFKNEQNVSDTGAMYTFKSHLNVHVTNSLTELRFFLSRFRVKHGHVLRLSCNRRENVRVDAQKINIITRDTHDSFRSTCE